MQALDSSSERSTSQQAVVSEAPSEAPSDLIDFYPGDGLPRVAMYFGHSVYHGGLAGVGKDAGGANIFRIRYDDGDDGDFDDLSIAEFLEAVARSQRICAGKW